MRIFPYTRTVVGAVGLAVAGVALVIPLVVVYLSNDFRLGAPNDVENHLAVGGLTLMLCAFLLFTLTLLLHGAVVATTRGLPHDR